MKSYRAEVVTRYSRYRSVPYASRELAASALPRLLATQFWQLRLSGDEPFPQWTIGVVEEDGPPCEQKRRDFDLGSFSEALRSQLYEQVVTDHFSAAPGATTVDRADAWPPYGPIEAGLEVLYLGGRWLATWKRLEIEDGIEEDRHELLRIHRTERGLTYCEI